MTVGFAPRVSAMADRIESWSLRRFFVAIALPLFALFIATASTRPFHIDAFTNVATAWELGAHGSIYLEHNADLADPEQFGNVAWVVTTPEGRPVSQYPPGAALLAAPLYRILGADAQRVLVQGINDLSAPPVEISLPSAFPAALAASAAVALAAALLGLAFTTLVTKPVALVAAYLAVLSTTAWSIAADALWQHGPDLLWISGGLAAAAFGRLALGGASFGLALITRPPTALVAAAVGLAEGWRRRSVWSVLRVGLPAAAGLAALLVYNRAVFGTPSITGGYGSAFSETALSSDVGGFVGNLVGAFFDPTRGLLVWAPFLLVLLPGLRAAWRAAPAWVRGSAVGGVLYLLVQLKANRFSGGGGFPAYRYPLEALAAAAPLLLLSYTEWVRGHLRAKQVFVWLMAAALAAQTVFAVV